jgi:hypothetical protein
MPAAFFLSSGDAVAETIQAYAAVIGLLLAFIGLPLVVLQLSELQRSARSAAHAAIYEQGASFRAHLIERPHLRKYFFDGVDIAATDPEYERVVTLAEVFLNYLEHVTVMIDSFGRGNRAALEGFVRNALARSPIMRRHLENDPALYSHALRRYLDS